jgi:hypothetical protein
MSNDIPTSVYVEFIDRTIAIHWAYHAILMIVTWFVIVPIGVIAIRFFQAKTDAEWHRTWGRVNMVDDSLLDPVCGHISALDVGGGHDRVRMPADRICLEPRCTATNPPAGISSSSR